MKEVIKHTNHFSTDLIKKSEKYVRGFLSDNLPDKICYHNVDHTIDVVNACEKIGTHCRLNKDQLETVIVAAWFHDTGYYNGKEQHEDLSAKIAEEFLHKEKIGQQKIDAIKGCIKATQIPQSPTNLIEKVICDADLYHLSSDEFFEKSELLHKETIADNLMIEKHSWLNRSLEFVLNHNYFTSFAKKFLCPRKDVNIKKLKILIDRKDNSD